MIKRLSASLALTAALVLSTGAGVAYAKPGHGHGHHHAHGFQACMAAAHTAYRAELASGVSRADARQHLHDAQAKCRSDFPSPRGK